MEKYDVKLDDDVDKITIEPHFCRLWDSDAYGNLTGCYGGNEDHGSTLEECADEVADYIISRCQYGSFDDEEREYLLDLAETWRNMSHEQIQNYLRGDEKC